MSTSRCCARLRQSRLILLGIIALAGLSFGTAGADESSVSEKTVRQIGVMEKIIDKVLIDSPNFLVSGGDNARGLYINEFGAVFTFEASLVNKMFNFETLFKGFSDNVEVTTNEDGDKVVIIHKDDEEKKEGKKGEEPKIVLEKEGREDAQVYEDGKKEMIQAILDYGETMSSLRDDQWLLLAAHLKGADYFKEMEISRLTLKAKMKDLRDFSAGRISEATAESRVVVEEY